MASVPLPEDVQLSQCLTNAVTCQPALTGCGDHNTALTDIFFLMQNFTMSMDAASEAVLLLRALPLFSGHVTLLMQSLIYSLARG